MSLGDQAEWLSRGFLAAPGGLEGDEGGQLLTLAQFIYGMHALYGGEATLEARALVCHAAFDADMNGLVRAQSSISAPSLTAVHSILWR